MTEEQVEGGLAERTVHGDGSVVPDRAVDDRDPGGEHNHHQDEVGTDETGDDARARDRIRDGAEFGGTAGGEKECGGRCPRAPQGGDQDVCDAGPAAVLLTPIRSSLSRPPGNDRAPGGCVRCHGYSFWLFAMRMP